MDFGFLFNRFFIFCLFFIPGIIYGKVNVVVSIVPQKTFVKKIAGDLANVSVMVTPGANPATYEPKPSQMRKIAKAEIYFSIGVPFEKAWISRFKAQNPNMRIVDTTKGIEKMPMQSHSHEHHDKPQNHPSSPDPHVWLSPSLVRILAKNIEKALEDIDPKHMDQYKKRAEKFDEELISIDRKLGRILEPCRGSAILVFHPSWGYFVKDYGLHQIAVEVEGKEPKPKQLLKLIKEIKEKSIKKIFIQPQFSRRKAETIARFLNVDIVVADPLAADWSENLIGVAEKICEIEK